MWPSSFPRWLSWLSSGPYARASSGVLTGASIGRAKTVAAFNTTLRQEVDLDQLREHLLAVVQETMQPAHVSLWLHKDEQTGKPNTDK